MVIGNKKDPPAEGLHERVGLSRLVQQAALPHRSTGQAQRMAEGEVTVL
jgi:hypothetical protein